MRKLLWQSEAWKEYESLQAGEGNYEKGQQIVEGHHAKWL